MKDFKITNVAVAGAGTMGAGIAQVCALSGYRVMLFDISDQMLQKAEKSVLASLGKMKEGGKISEQEYTAAAGAIKYTSDPETLRADLIIEAIIEKADVKIELFNKLAGINGDRTIYATNTSSIPVTKIASGVQFPGLVAGIHFFNPAQIMKLVEIIKGARTEDWVVDACVAFVNSLKKIPVVAADSPGFIVNRVARPYYVEALKALEENVASFDSIDRIMESSGFKMGPFRLMDLIGVDTNYSVTESQYSLFSHEARFRPSRIQKQKVDAGLHGRKTGGGFYSYDQ